MSLKSDYAAARGVRANEGSEVEIGRDRLADLGLVQWLICAFGVSVQRLALRVITQSFTHAGQVLEKIGSKTLEGMKRRRSFIQSATFGASAPTPLVELLVQCSVHFGNRA